MNTMDEDWWDRFWNDHCNERISKMKTFEHSKTIVNGVVKEDVYAIDGKVVSKEYYDKESASPEFNFSLNLTWGGTILFLLVLAGLIVLLFKLLP